MSAPAERPIDVLALSRVRQRMLARAQVPWLHGEVARRMGERLTIVREAPQTVLDWGRSVGGGSEVLASAYPAARHARIGERPPGVRSPSAGSWWSRLARRSAAPDVGWMSEAEVGAGEAGLVWANMVLHGEPDPRALMQRWHRALRVGGFLMFSTLGPGTLPELRELYAEQGWGPHGNVLVDMHDQGDMLVEAGFADPVMDQETLRLTWADPLSALQELRGLGANVHLGRHQGLRTPRWRDRLLAALQARARQQVEGRVELSFEIVYGHAFRAPATARVAEETRVDLAQMRAMVRARRP